MYSTKLQLDAHSFNAGMDAAKAKGKQSLGAVGKESKVASLGVQKIGDAAAGMAGVAGGAIRSVIGVLSKLGPAGMAVAAIFAVVAAAITAPIMAAKRLSETFDRIGKAAKGLGIAADEYFKLAAASREAGVEEEKTNQLLIKFSDKIEEAANGSQKAIDAFRSIGLSWADLRRKSPAKAFLEIVDACKKIKKEGKEIPSMIRDIVGARGMMNFNKLVADDFSANFNNAPTIDNSVVAAAEDLQNSFANLNASVQAYFGTSEITRGLMNDLSDVITILIGSGGHLKWLWDLLYMDLRMLSFGVKGLALTILTVTSILQEVIAGLELMVGGILKLIGKIPGLGDVGELGDYLLDDAKERHNSIGDAWNDVLDNYEKHERQKNGGGDDRDGLGKPNDGPNARKAKADTTFSDAGKAIGSDKANLLKQVYEALDKSGDPAAEAAAKKLAEDIQRAFDEASSPEDYARRLNEIYDGIGKRIPAALGELNKAVDESKKRIEKFAKWDADKKAKAEQQKELNEAQKKLDELTKDMTKVSTQAPDDKVIASDATAAGAMRGYAFIDHGSDRRLQVMQDMKKTMTTIENDIARLNRALTGM